MASTTSQRLSSEPRPADVLVVFGITGDLATLMRHRPSIRTRKRKVLGVQTQPTSWSRGMAAGTSRG